MSKSTNLGYPWKTGKTKKEGKKYNPKRSAYDQQANELPILKKARPWYQKIHSTVLQQNLKRLNEAFKKFFERGAGYPKFKRRSRFRSFSYPPGQVQFNNNAICLPSIGWMNFYKSRDIPIGFTVKTVTVRRKARWVEREDSLNNKVIGSSDKLSVNEGCLPPPGWYLSLRLEDKTVPEIKKIELSEISSAIGVDLGLRKLVSVSNGQTIETPKFFARVERLLTIRQRRASRKVKGSKNRAKAYQKVSRLHQKIKTSPDRAGFKKQDFHWKLAHQLCRNGELIVAEDLNIKGMMKRCKAKQKEDGKYLKNGQSAKAKLNRLIADASWVTRNKKIREVFIYKFLTTSF